MIGPIDKVGLISGANKGIGFETARHLGRKQITVLLGVRDLGRGEAAGKLLRDEQIDAHVVLLDLTDHASITAAARHITDRYGKLDILVNNAGVGPEQIAPSQTTMESLRRSFETNFFGTFAVTQAMLPLLRKAGSARIVNVSSGWSSLTNSELRPNTGFNPLAYNAAKASLNALTVALAIELRNTPIKVNAADPGYAATDMTNHTGPQTAAEAAKVVAALALLPDDGPTGGFFNQKGRVPW